ncbi:cadmium resistance transporter [Clostridium sp. MSJ-11]|uniref:Cadmium resistance transporter n=1 Tax=Clostridium mobile TaxID=2841512 RepID=A0ABS6EF74_9CLOT|nr:cadmium resistance transporter [Clostridium mobile]MBU5483855.1 cadmium resistance transporter [Clostridium mobile]
MISTLITAFVAFVSTNIDDIFILMLFFSQINNAMKIRHIVIGQYLGVGALITISIIGALGVSIIPYEYVGLLGLVPIYLGIKAYVDYKKESKDNESTGEQELQKSENSKVEEIIEETTDTKGNGIITSINNLINLSVVKVFGVTFANGGDNIGIYIPLFSSMNSVDILITVIIFMTLTAVWCFVGMKLSEHHFVQRNIEKYKHIFVPIIFIGLGVFILIESGIISLIYKKIL